MRFIIGVGLDLVDALKVVSGIVSKEMDEMDLCRSGAVQRRHRTTRELRQSKAGVEDRRVKLVEDAKESVR
eukprot:11455570-Karenia_brevis.AAC.1